MSTALVVTAKLLEPTASVAVPELVIAEPPPVNPSPPVTVTDVTVPALEVKLESLLKPDKLILPFVSFFEH